jgi:hypothetical protein
MRDAVLQSLSWIFSAAIGCAVGAYLVLHSIILGAIHGPPVALAAFAFAFAAFVGALVVHEFGHVWWAALAGVSWTRLSLGPLVVERNGRRWWFRNPSRTRLSWYAMFGGMRSRKAWAMMIVGGPVANLVLTCGCFALAACCDSGQNFVFPGQRPLIRSGAVGWLFPTGLVAAPFRLVGMISLLPGVCTLVPGRVAGMRTDGGQLLDILRGAALPLVVIDPEQPSKPSSSG